MGVGSGAFFGYRERPPDPKKRIYSWVFTPPAPEIRLQNWSWDLLGPTPFGYDVYRGLAEDDYQDNFVLFPFLSRAILVTIRDAPGHLIFTYDGIVEEPEREFDLGFMKVESIIGFKVRNAHAGNICRYQVVPMR